MVLKKKIILKKGFFFLNVKSYLFCSKFCLYSRFQFGFAWFQSVLQYSNTGDFKGNEHGLFYENIMTLLSISLVYHFVC